MESQGKVTLTVNLYDKTKVDGKGNLIYQCFSDKASKDSNDFIEQSKNITVPDTFVKKNATDMVSVSSTDIVRLLQATSVKTTCIKEGFRIVDNYTKVAVIGAVGGSLEGCVLGALSGTIFGGPIGAGMGCITGMFFGGSIGAYVVPEVLDTSYEEITQQEYDCIKKFVPLQHVIIEVKIKNARLKKIKLPLFGEKDISELFNSGENGLKVSILINDNKKVDILYPQQENNLPTINLIMGDKVDFVVEKDDELTPKIFGVPDVWVAPFAGDLMFHCNASVQPGEVQPFIGFDSRVHTLMLRAYPKKFKKHVPDWSKNYIASGKKITYTWSWTANREMSANKTKYVPSYIWAKEHIDKNGNLTTQRQNQKEGLNMQYLSYFNNWRDSNFTYYDGNTEYMLGFDDDELGYFNHKFAQVENTLTAPTEGGVVKLEKLPWKKIIEGNQEYNKLTGFPEKGFPLNIIVNAYRKANAIYPSRGLKRRGVFEKLPPYHDYIGYEIQDTHTSKDNPNGNGSNVTHPGLVTISIGDYQEIKFKLNVESPLDKVNGRSLGFYEALKGSDNPSYAEQKVVYWLDGIEKKPDSEIKKYTLEYNSMNRLGNIDKKTKNMLDIVKEKRVGGAWLGWLNTSRPAYAWIIAYYQRTLNSAKVPIAGKELNQIFLMFCGVEKFDDQPFKQGKGHGSKIFLEDIRNNKYGKYNTIKNYGTITNPKYRYTNKYANAYVVPTGTKLTFTTFDGDPHRFDNADEEWYLSNRSMAKRVKDGVLDGSSLGGPDKAALKYYIGAEGSSSLNLITNNRVGKNVTYTFENKGSFDLRVTYRGGSDLYNHIKVINYPNSLKGQIKTRDLTLEEKNWLGLGSNSNYKAYEVVDVYSKFLWEDGFRNPNVPSGKPNRWAKNNDYLDAYIWEYGGSKIENNSDIVDRITEKFKLKINEWFWSDWALHYSSNWLRPLNAQGLQGIPNYVPESKLVRIKEYSDLDDYNGYIKNNIFNNSKYTSQLKTPWQFVIPLVSYTDFHGYRFRTNPSCIYDLNRVFSSIDGAFTGNPTNPTNPNDIQAPNISDENKDMQEFYHAIKNERILIKENLGSGTVLKAYQKANYNGQKGTLVAEFNTNKRFYMRKKRVVTKENAFIGGNDETLADKYFESTIVYPNSSTGIFNVIASYSVGKIIEITIYNLLRKQLYSKKVNLSRQTTVDLSFLNLNKGIYLMGIRGVNGNTTKKIILKYPL